MEAEILHLNSKKRNAIHSFLHKLEDEIGDQILSVYLFGSQARGDAQPDSDIDLAVLVKKDSPEIRTAVRNLASEVWLESDLFLSTRIWSKSHWQRLEQIQTRLYRNIQRDGIELLRATAKQP